LNLWIFGRPAKLSYEGETKLGTPKRDLLEFKTPIGCGDDEFNIECEGLTKAELFSKVSHSLFLEN
jgi:hypothetical protein